MGDEEGKKKEKGLNPERRELQARRCKEEAGNLIL